MKQVKQLLREVILGMVMWDVLISIILAFVSVWIKINPVAAVLGVIVGSLTAAGLLFHMYRHLDIALDMPPEGASKHTQFAAMMRMLVMAAVMAVAFIFGKYLNPGGVAFGIMGLKASALLNPVLHASLEKRKQIV